MQTASSEVIALENKFWQSMVNEDADTALSMLTEPSFMISSHGAMKFDHNEFKKMIQSGSMTINSFELSDMNVTFPSEDTALVTYKAKQSITMRGQSKPVNQEMTDSSVWTRSSGEWRCALHTETPVDSNAH